MFALMRIGGKQSKGLIQVDRLKPTPENQAVRTQSELLGEALIEAEDQGIWSDSEGEQH